jgi:hypothetical protein
MAEFAPRKTILDRLAAAGPVAAMLALLGGEANAATNFSKLPAATKNEWILQAWTTGAPTCSRHLQGCGLSAQCQENYRACLAKQEWCRKDGSCVPAGGK